MDSNLVRVKWTAIGLAVLLAAGCSRADKPAEADATADAPAPAPAATAATAPMRTGDITLEGTGIFPESITSTADGTLYIGSIGKAQIYRVAAGSTAAEVFVAPGTGGAKQIFGVYADGRTNTLWACSNQLAPGPPGAAPPGPSALHGFDLATGAAKANHALPNGGMCNDIVTHANGDVFITDTQGMLVMRLPRDGAALQPWSAPGAFGPAGGVLDGITIVGDRLVVNTLVTSKLFAVDILSDGKAGDVKDLTLSAPLSGPDGMRAYGNNGLLVTDNTGKIQHVVVSVYEATVTPVKEGLDGPVSVTAVGKTGYAVEGQLGVLFTPPGGTPPPERPYRVITFTLP